MAEILSQEEIDALLRSHANPASSENVLTPEEIDALGEIGNISMGTAATALFTLLNRKVTITTPEVSITTIRKLSQEYPVPFVVVEIFYTAGLEGINLLVIHEDDVKIITDLMMGGDGTNTEGELSELHLSAIGEVMNQMIGSAATSLSKMFNKNINISPPKTFVVNFASEKDFGIFDPDEPIVKINFKMQVGNLIDSYIMQLLPIDFAKELVKNLLGFDEQKENNVEDSSNQTHVQAQQLSDKAEHRGTFYSSQETLQKEDNKTTDDISSSHRRAPINVQPVSFQQLEEAPAVAEGNKNINLILDVPLQISVELGRTTKSIKEILELASGSIIELDKMAGEPVDILVNGKLIAKGEVVVIDDSFGVRITDIISPDKRLSNL